MTHLIMFFLVISLGFGLGSIAITTQQYNIYKLKFIKFLLIFLISSNIVVIFSLFYNYSREYLFSLPYEYLAVTVEIGYRLFASIILFVIIGSMIYMLRSLVNQEPSKRYIKILILTWIILVSFFFLGIGTMFDKSTLPIPILVNVIIDQLGQYIVLFEIIRSFFFISSIKDLVNRSSTRILLLIIGGIWSSIIILSFMTIIGFIENDILNIISAFIFILFNAIPLIFLKSYLRKVYGVINQKPINTNIYADSDEVFARHDITPREQDIIKLICEGYANKIIADKLCISVHTVKDHNYRIFKKLGVTNRVQLTNKFKHISNYP